MSNPINRLFCRLDGLTPGAREKRRVETIKSLSLLEMELTPIFEETTQMVARNLEIPICILGLRVNDEIVLKSACGLSHLGLMNSLAVSRRLPVNDSFCVYVIDSQQPLVIQDAFREELFSRLSLVHEYQIRAYLGVPLLTKNEICIGTLAVMDLAPRNFEAKDQAFLEIAARLCLTEHQNQLSRRTSTLSSPKSENFVLTDLFSRQTNAHLSNNPAASPNIAEVKLEFLNRLIQELTPPLTSSIGMSSALLSEMFGDLGYKQRQYLEIVYKSGQKMNKILAQILELSGENNHLNSLNLRTVNMEIICENLLFSLNTLAEEKGQKLRLSIEPGQQMWLLDESKIKQAIYFLVLTVINSSESFGEIRVHVSRKTQSLNVAVWLYNPWLGDGLPTLRLSENLSFMSETIQENSDFDSSELGFYPLHSSSLESAINGQENVNSSTISKTANNIFLTLLLACYFTESHQGNLMIQGKEEEEKKYVIRIPQGTSLSSS